jgi:uncharacterized protein (TIGR02246 family)
MKKSCLIFNLIFIFTLCTVSLAKADSDKRAKEDIQKTMNSFAEKWNKHDIKGMAEMWSKDGDVINPYGRIAKGRDEIQKLITDEHQSFMKDTTMKIQVTLSRLLKRDYAVADCDVVISGMKNSEGKVGPDLPHHLVVVLEKDKRNWDFVDLRPYVFQSPPSQAAPMNPAENKEKKK